MLVKLGLEPRRFSHAWRHPRVHLGAENWNHYILRFSITNIHKYTVLAPAARHASTTSVSKLPRNVVKAIRLSSSIVYRPCRRTHVHAGLAHLSLLEDFYEGQIQDVVRKVS